MNDEETVALIVGGHTVGKCHGAVDPQYLGPEPEGCPVEHQGLGWKNSYGSGVGVHALTSGLEGAWTNEPVTWDNGYLDNLFRYDWELTTSPAGAQQWTPKNPEAQGTVPDAHDPSRRHAPMMLTSDLALRVDPIYGPIAKRFHENPDQLADAFAKAWYKLLHRDMGPLSRYLGPWVPEPQLWQDPVPAVDHDLVSDEDVAALKGSASSARACRSPSWSPLAWASAASFRGTDKRGGANGARIRLAPQRDWEVNDRPSWRGAADPRADPAGLQRLESGGTKISLADLIVLGGCAAVEKAAKDAGQDVTVPFAPGRTDASQEQTDVESFAVLEPKADGFRNYLRAGEKLPPETLLLDRAFMLNADRAGDDGAGRRHAGARRQRRAGPARRLHRPARDADQRLLREPARHGHGVEAVGVRGERLRGSRPRHRRGHVDGHRRRPRLRSHTRSSAPSRRSTRPTTRRRSSCATSWPRGTRS